MEQISMAMIGAGSVVHLYLPVFKCLEKVRPVALVDINEPRARWLAHRYGVEKVYTEVKQAAADPQIDAVIVATPPNLHAEHAQVCAAAGKHVLCEKPMASTVGECQRIIDACRQGGASCRSPT